MPEYTANQNVNVYPNPANNQLIVSSERLTVAEIKIYNVIGELVYSSKVNTAKTTIDVSSYPVGLYFIGVQTATQSINKKFIKQ
jgi:glucuronoarabinoxylan endo-1,4-beta-xylanase